MLLQKGFKLPFSAFYAILLLSGCTGSIFPDFAEDSDIVVDDGGKVEVRKVEQKGILVADKDNAAYEDDTDEEIPAAVTAADNTSSDLASAKETDQIAPAKVVAVKSEEISPVAPASVAAEQPSAPSMHYLAATIYFADGGAVIDSSYLKNIRQIARLAKENHALVTVYGFASSRTRDTDPATHKLVNFKVSAERAENTARALRRAGIPADKIVVQAMSDSAPMYQEVMPEGERLNRRAEIYLTY